MPQQITTVSQRNRVEAGVPFVQALARRVAASMPHSIDLGDLVQDGMLGLIDAAHRFDAARGIKFETFAERRVRGAMIDALRRNAWPRGIRRVRRELEAAREALRRELGCEPSLADLAARVGSDETRLGRTIVRINTIESTSPLATADSVNEASLPPVMVPSEPAPPDKAFEQVEIKSRVRAALATLPWRERKVIGLYYYGEVTMKAHRRRDWRERIARVAIARARHPATPKGALGGFRFGRGGGGRAGCRARQDAAARQQASHAVSALRVRAVGTRGRVAVPEAGAPGGAPGGAAGAGEPTAQGGLGNPLAGGMLRPDDASGVVPGPLSATRQAGTAWRASGSRFLRESARRQCRPRHR